jgi:hypothetical protein
MLMFFVVCGGLVIQCVAGYTCIRSSLSVLDGYMIACGLEMVFEAVGIKIYMTK